MKKINVKITMLFKIGTIIVLLASCSSQKSAMRGQKFAPIAFDPMQAESLERLAWDGKEELKGYPHELILCFKGKFDEAFKLLKAQSDKKNDPKYWNIVGSCYFWKKDYAKSKFYFDMGLAVDVHDVDLQHNLAMVFLMHGNYESAIAHLLKLTQSSSKTLLARWNLALIYYSLRSPELAVVQLKLLQGVAPQDPLVGLMLMKSYINQEKYQLAIDSYARIPSHLKNYPELKNYYTYALFKMGDLKNAEKNLGSNSDFKEKTDLEFHLELVKYLQKQQRDLATQQGGSI